MKQIKVKLLKKEKITSDHFLYTLESNGLTFQPGQFINILCQENADFILRRPISIFSSDEKSFQIFFESKGKGTRALSEYETGQEIDIVGPLGKGFSLNENAVLIAGGMGIAPLTFLANELNNSKIIIGAQTKEKLFTFGLPKNHEIHIATDDGSKGFNGNAVMLMNELLPKLKPDFIYACGPQIFMDKVVDVTKKANIPTEVSLERFMACGVGVCLSCVCETKSGYQRVCTEGPVFSSQELRTVGT